MSAPNIVIDGTHFYGSWQINIGAVAFVFDDLAIERPVETASDLTEVGLPNRSRYTAGPVNGTATVQLPSTGIPPAFGDTFTEEFDENYGNEIFVVMSVNVTFTNSPGDIRKASIRFAKVYNGSVTTVA